MLPSEFIKLEGKSAQQMLKLVEALEDHDDTKNVWANFDVDPKANTVGLWGERVAGVVFTDAHELYVASHRDEELESFAEKWGLELSYG